MALMRASESWTQALVQKQTRGEDDRVNEDAVDGSATGGQAGQEDGRVDKDAVKGSAAATRRLFFFLVASDWKWPDSLLNKKTLFSKCRPLEFLKMNDFCTPSAPLHFNLEHPTAEEK